MRLLRDKEIKEVHEIKLKELDARCVELKREVDLAQEKSIRHKLLNVSPVCHVEQKGNVEYLNNACKIQNQTQDALSRALHLVETTKEVGQCTLDEQPPQQSICANSIPKIDRVGLNANKNRSKIYQQT